ncbi:hypothetical protein DLC15_22660 [Salmonella enterica subsp. enterica serovar Telelkebir]|nr:hypothetical protein [Salmonella enterica subsp. enterica serovar Telelkebir]
MKTIKGRMTKKKAEIMGLFDASMGEHIKFEVGGWPLTAGEVVHLTNGIATLTKEQETDRIRAMRRTLETMVRDGYLVHEVSEDYYEVSTGRTIKRKGVAYDVPKFLRVGRPEGTEKYNKYGDYDSGFYYFDVEKEGGKGRIIEGEVVENDKTGSLDLFDI